MSLHTFNRNNRSITNLNKRDLSPRPFNNIASHNVINGNLNKSSTSIHSQHLWNTLQELELFPAELSTLLRYQDRNITSFKNKIDREKSKVSTDVQSFKKQMIHYIDDFRLSVMAQLDQVYKLYMERYAKLKGDILEIKRLRDQIQMEVSNKSSMPNYRNLHNPNYLATSNLNTVKSIEEGLKQMKKYHILNYITQLQKSKITPVSENSKDLLILTQYQNGFYQGKQLNSMLVEIKQIVKTQLGYLYQNKEKYFREIQSVVGHSDHTQITVELQEDNRDRQRQRYSDRPERYQNKLKQPSHHSSKIQVKKKQLVTVVEPVFVSPSQQIAAFQWLQQPKISSEFSLKSDTQDIILCALVVNNDEIAIGSKDGVLTIYSISSGNRINSLKGHRASICSLAIINAQGIQYLASGSDHGCSSIFMWEISTWVLRHKLEGHKAAVTAIVDLLDGQSMISGSYDKKINIYNLKSGKISYNLPTNKSSVTGIILNSSGTHMVSCGLDNSLNIWQVIRNPNNIVQTLFLKNIISNTTMICSLVGSTINQDIIYVGTKDGKVKLINIEKGQSYKTLTCCNNAVIQMVVLERQSRPNYPIIVAWPCKQQCMKLINTESGKINNISVRGHIEFGCGIGPKGLLLKNGHLAMLSQSQQRKQINFYRIQQTSR